MGDSSSKSLGQSQGPFNFGPSPFDLNAIFGALGDATSMFKNRYEQLGLGGSTMEQQDLQGVQNQAQALIGQEQTQTVQDPAINTALQGPSTTQSTALSTLGSLSNLATNQTNQAETAAGAANPLG